MLTITKRTAKIGNAIQSRSEMHGEDSVTAIDIPLSMIMLTAVELNAIMREPYAHNALFNHRVAGGGLVEPMLKHIKPIALDEKIEGAKITITHGVDAEVIRLAPVKLAKIRLEPQLGGLTSMACTAQCTPDLDVNIAHLLERLNATVEIEIDGGEFGAQGELSLTGQQEGESDEPDAGGEGGDDPDAVDDRPTQEIAATPPIGETKRKPGRPRKNADHALAH